MNDDEKRRFDALTSLRDHAWSEFESKSRAEWQLSLGLWAAVLASAAVVLGSQALKVSGREIGLSALLLSALFVAHVSFLLWIQTRLKDSREHIAEAHGEMRALASMPARPRTARRDGWKQPSLWVQAGITVIVSATLLVVLGSKAG